jgi:chitin disaccharide deacetylase
LTEQSLSAALSELPEGSTEFMCHPGYLGEDLRRAATRLKETRERELAALTSTRVKDVIASRGIVVTNFLELSERG